MSNKQLTNTDIQSFNEEISSFIEKFDMTNHNKLWLQLFLEESLLRYKDSLGDKASFSYTIKKRFSILLVELYVNGKSVNVLHPDMGNVEDSGILDGLFNNGDGQTLYRYKNGQNVISVSMPIEKA